MLPIYAHAIYWIAHNDNASATKLSDIEGTLTVLMVADLFAKSEKKVARDVRAVRVGTAHVDFDNGKIIKHKKGGGK